jgi:hypothetical protein
VRRQIVDAVQQTEAVAELDALSDDLP